MTIHHVSDLHFHKAASKNRAVVGKLRALAKSRGDTDLLVVTGDVTDDGQEEQYVQAYRALSPFAGSILLCPGNHDYGPVGNFYEAAAERRWKEFCLSLGSTRTATCDGVLCIALDSCLRTVSPLDFAQGRLAQSELDFARVQISLARSHLQPVAVFFHHDPVNDIYVERLQNAQDVLSALYGMVDLVGFGHTHKEWTWTQPRGLGTVVHRCINLGARGAKPWEWNP